MSDLSNSDVNDIISAKTNRADPDKQIIISKPLFNLKDVVIIDTLKDDYSYDSSEIQILEKDNYAGIIVDSKYSFLLSKWFYDIKITAKCYIIDVKESSLSLK